MKDQLGRDIVVGDTLAFITYDYSLATGGPAGYPQLTTAKVREIASFALQASIDILDAKGRPATKDHIIVDSTKYLIVAFAPR
jgi:hypothetical protein